MMFVLTGGHSAAAHTAICPFTPSTTPSDYDILLPPQGNRRRPDRLPASHLISVCHCHCHCFNCYLSWLKMSTERTEHLF